MVCELGVGEGRFWVADESPEHRNFSPETLGGGSVRMVMELSDPNAFYARAVKAGATAVCPMKDEYGGGSGG